jgi:hypothetical protein
MTGKYPETSAYDRVAVLTSSLVGVVLAIGSVWLTTFLLGGSASASSESLFRVGPTIRDGGVGADWTAGNTIPALDFLIALIHAADVILGVFILVLVFVHWAVFRRLASRMRRPNEDRRSEGVATDGGREPGTGGERPTGRDTDAGRSEAGEKHLETGGGGGGDRR